MGGLGSGRRPGFPTTLDDLRAVDLRYLRRQGMLEPGRGGTLRWSRAGRETGSIGLRCSGDAVFLSYRVTSWRGAAAEDVEERVPLVRTAQPFGGERLWFACPGCGRRCAVLYGGRRFRCRLCVGAPYGSQHEAPHERLLRRLQAIRARLGGNEYASLDMPFPPRPKRMRRATYRRLRARAGRLERAMSMAAAERFGLTAEGPDGLF
jgi:hypothetical protein